MFGLFSKNPIKKLNEKYNDLLKKAVDAQRNGNIELYASLTAQANETLKEIEKLENEAITNKGQVN